MRVVTKPPPTTSMPELETDRLMHSLVKSLDLARLMQMAMLEQLIEMALIELGQMIAAREKHARDQNTH